LNLSRDQEIYFQTLFCIEEIGRLVASLPALRLFSIHFYFFLTFSLIEGSTSEISARKSPFKATAPFIPDTVTTPLAVTEYKPKELVRLPSNVTASFFTSKPDSEIPS
jgi:hypothetical protein